MHYLYNAINKATADLRDLNLRRLKLNFIQPLQLKLKFVNRLSVRFEAVHIDQRAIDDDSVCDVSPLVGPPNLRQASYYDMISS